VTSRRACGASRTRRHAATASVVLSPSSAPVAKYRQTAAGNRSRAMAGSASIQRPPGSVISVDLDAGQVLLPAPQHQPGAVDQVLVAWHVLGVGDPLVVEVGTALADGAPRLALAPR